MELIHPPLSVASKSSNLNSQDSKINHPFGDSQIAREEASMRETLISAMTFRSSDLTSSLPKVQFTHHYTHTH